MFKSLIFLTLIFLSFVGLYIIEMGTAEPGSGAGNGNPMLLVVLLFIPIFLSSFILLVDRVKKLLTGMKMSTTLKLLACSMIAMLVVTYLHIQFINKRIIQLGGGPNVPESWIYRFGWLNQYTNTFYFHYYVFIFFLLLLMNVTILVHIMRKNRR